MPPAGRMALTGPNGRVIPPESDSLFGPSAAREILPRPGKRGLVGSLRTEWRWCTAGVGLARAIALARGAESVCVHKSVSSSDRASHLFDARYLLWTRHEPAVD